MTNYTAQTTPSLVPTKHKADDEIRSVDKAAYDEYYQYVWGSEDEHLDLVFTAILEEDNALRRSGCLITRSEDYNEFHGNPIKTRIRLELLS